MIFLLSLAMVLKRIQSTTDLPVGNNRHDQSDSKIENSVVISFAKNQTTRSNPG